MIFFSRFDNFTTRKPLLRFWGVNFPLVTIKYLSLTKSSTSAYMLFKWVDNYKLAPLNAGKNKSQIFIGVNLAFYAVNLTLNRYINVTLNDHVTVKSNQRSKKNTRFLMPGLHLGNTILAHSPKNSMVKVNFNKR